MRFNSHRAVLSLIAVLVIGLGISWSASARQQESLLHNAKATVSGTVVRVADASAGKDMYLRVSNKPMTMVQITGGTTSTLKSGQRVSAVVKVPSTVANAGMESGSVKGISGDIHLSKVEVMAAAGVAARADSALSQASIAHSVENGGALQVLSVSAPSEPLPQPVRRAMHEVTVVRASLGAYPAPSEATVRQDVAKASAYWATQTRGVVSFKVVKMGTIAFGMSACSDAEFIWNAAARRVGFVAGANRHLVVGLPTYQDMPEDTLSKCKGGVASTSYRMPNEGGTLYWRSGEGNLLAHELGHNLGSGHANALICSQPDAVPAKLPRGCQQMEYGDVFDVMGYSSPDEFDGGSFSIGMARHIGLTVAGETVDVLPGQQKEFWIFPRSGHKGLQGIFMTDPRNGVKYFIDFRTRSGYDKDLEWDLKSGVRIHQHVTDADGFGNSMVLDPTPNPRLELEDLDRTIAPGTRLFRSVAKGIAVQVKAQGSQAALVRVAVAK